MKAMNPYVDVPGDNESRIMSRSGDCAGMSKEFAVWRFGFLKGSDHAKAHGVTISNQADGFLWVFATRKAGKIKDTQRGYAVELPKQYRSVIDWEPK